MPFRHVSRDIKLAAIRLYERDLLPLEDILDCVGFSQRTFDRIHALWVRTGDVVKHKFGTQGCPRALKFDDVDYLFQLIHQRPDWFLNELQFLLQTNRFIAVHLSPSIGHFYVLVSP
jgi:Homeodomain-like domain